MQNNHLDRIPDVKESCFKLDMEHQQAMSGVLEMKPQQATSE